MNSLFVAPLLAACLACTGLYPGATRQPEPGRGAGRAAPPQLVSPGQSLAHVAEAGATPELSSAGEVHQVRVAPATGSASRAGARPRSALPRVAAGARAGTNHTPLYFGSLPPPA